MPPVCGIPRVRVCLRGLSCLRGRVCLRAGTSDRCAPAVLSLPPLRGGPLTVHEATGGYAVRSPCPSGIPRPRHNASPLGLEGLPCFDLFAASIRKSGPEIKNRCTNQPIFSTHPQHIPPARVHHALTTRLALDVLHGDSDAGSTVAAKAGADAPGGGISLSFCRRGCAAPAQKAATLNDQPPRNQPKPLRNRRHPRHKPTQPTKKSGRKVSAGLLIQIIMMQSSKP